MGMSLAVAAAGRMALRPGPCICLGARAPTDKRGQARQEQVRVLRSRTPLLFDHPIASWAAHGAVVQCSWARPVVLWLRLL